MTPSRGAKTACPSHYLPLETRHVGNLAGSAYDASHSFDLGDVLRSQQVAAFIRALNAWGSKSPLPSGGIRS